MKNVIVLLLIALSAVSCNPTKKATSPTEIVILNEKSEQILGDWRSIEYQFYAEVSFYKSGTAVWKMFENESHYNKFFEFESSWEIKEDQLTVKISKVNYMPEGVSGIEVGQGKTIKIIELSNNRLILEDESGEKTKMIRL